MNLQLKRCLAVAGLCCFASFALAGQNLKPGKEPAKASAKSSAKPEKENLLAATQFQQAAISPDGRRVAWVEIRTDDAGSPTGKQDIYVAASTGAGKPRRVTAGQPAGHYDEGSVAWSPDGKRLTFLSDAAKSGQLRLYVSSVNGSAAQELTNGKGFLQDPKWSPDGKTIAVLFTENATREAGPLVAETPETGEIKDAFFEQRLALVDLGSAKLRQVTPADTYIYEYDWAPDSKTILLTAAKGNGDSNWYIAELFSLDTTAGKIRSIYKPPLQIGRPAVSLDGKYVAFISGLMSDEDSIGGDVFLLPLAGGEPRNLTPDRKASASALQWASSGKLIVGENLEGDAGISQIDPASGQIETLYRAPEFMTLGYWGTSVSLTSDGSAAAFIRSSFSAPPEIWAGPIGKWTQLTRANADVKPAWGEAKSLHWKSDGFDVQGWLIYPANFDPSKKYPLVVSVHGGPGGGVQSAWPEITNYRMALPAHGYFVLYPNPRGSFGQGEAFTRANVRDFGYGDWRDIMAGLDEAIRVAPADPQRLGLTGWSYGGFMTMWGVTQTGRFKAAVAGAGIANWSSYYGENKIDQWMLPFFVKSYYDDPQVYARSSPLTFINNVKTPTLIIVGDSDGECPTPQSYEFWHALRTLGVQTELVVYEREGHMFVKPEHIRDVRDRSLAWFDQYLK
jgi:dipeptidyl aminopeptidase/acylaminoacyl peptidase